MAVSSQGTTVSFGGLPLGKVVGVNANFSSPHKEIRPLAQSLEFETGQYLPTYEQTVCEQSVELETIASTGVTSSIVGSKGQLLISGTDWSVTFGVAVCESFKIAAKVGDVVRINLAFKRTYA